MHSLSWLSVFLLAVPAPASARSAALPTGAARAGEEEEAVKHLAAQMAKLLASGGAELDWFLENYTPGARDKMTDERLLMFLGMFRKDVPSGELREARLMEDGRARIVLFSESTDTAVVLDIDLEPTPPHRIAGLGARLEDGDPRAPGMVDGMAPEQMASFLDGFVGDLAERDRFSGAVLLAKDGEIVFEKAYGLASRRFDVPNRIDTRFNLGSMNKMFTAVAILQLAQGETLDLDDKLIEHLPHYPNREVAEKISIHQLLTHTSGMGSFWEAMFARDWTTLREPADHLELFVEDALLFEPGERFSYSNSGFLVLGLVVEAVTGKSYYDYVREQVFLPAGMPGTDSYAMDEPVPNLAIGYTRSGPDGHGHDGPLRNNLYLHRMRGGPAGGGFSTVHDMHAFAQALLGFQLLEAEWTERLLAGKVATGWGADDQYGYGMVEQRVEGHRLFGHSGGAPGINAELGMFPDEGYTFVVLANYDGAAAGVAARMREMIARADD